MSNRAEMHEFLKEGFEIWLFIRQLEIGNKCKISAQYLQNTPARPKKHGNVGC